jgi:NAD(P)-dependent dehydrogenase (short-subunit alcohol dehydrogenase family)
MSHSHIPGDAAGAILLIGASRGLGHAMAAEFLKREWKVVGTVRAGSGRTKLHDLADEHSGRVEIEILDINDAGQLATLRDRLSGRVFDMLFVNAGITNRDPNQTISDADVTAQAAPQAAAFFFSEGHLHAVFYRTCTTGAERPYNVCRG